MTINKNGFINRSVIKRGWLENPDGGSFSKPRLISKAYVLLHYTLAVW